MDQPTSKIAQYISEKQVANDLAVSKALLRKMAQIRRGSTIYSPRTMH